MDACTLAASPVTAPLWLMTLIIGGWLVLMCLKTIGHGYDSAVKIHNLRVATRQLQLKHDREVRAMRREAIRAANQRLDAQFSRRGDRTTGPASDADTGADSAPAKAA